PEPDESRWTSRPVLLAVGALVLVLALVGLGLVALLRGGGEDPAADRAPGDRPIGDSGAASADASAELSSALTWLTANTTADTSLLIPDRIADRLAEALPGRLLATYTEAVPTLAGTAHLVVVTPDLEQLASGHPARGVAEESVLVGSFGSELEVRQVLAPGTSWEADRAARSAAGGELTSNPALTFTPAAADRVRAGDLDARLMMILAGLALQHSAEVDVPTDPVAEAAGAPTRVMHVLAVDGRSVAENLAAATTVTRLVGTQDAPLATQDVRLTSALGRDVVVVRYPLPSPTGLLAGAGFPTTRSSP
ncbi:MAG: hypothetical protein ACRDWY_11230, partial [Actinomycetes bacterium]